jgi:hypothetical protein
MRIALINRTVRRRVKRAGVETAQTLSVASQMTLASGISEARRPATSRSQGEVERPRITSVGTARRSMPAAAELVIFSPPQESAWRHEDQKSHWGSDLKWLVQGAP